MRILIVEDEAIIAEDIRQIASAWGHSVRWAITGEKAEQCARNGWPDLILMDANLQRKGDGVEAAARILKHYDVPVIFVTSVPIGEIFDNFDYLNLKCRYLSKPIDARKLEIAIQQTFEPVPNRVLSHL